MKLVLVSLAIALAPLAFSRATPTAAGPVNPAGSAFGPPLVCFPFDIANAESLPWPNKPDAFECDPKYPSASLVVDTVKILDGSTDIIVHMETLRRAAIYANKFGDRPVKGSEQMTKGAASLVSDRVLVKALDRSMRILAKDPKSALAWIDAGYALGAIEKMGNYHGCDYTAYFRNAVAIAPEDPGARFALAVGILDSPEHEKWEAAYKSALTSAPKDSLLRKNVLAFGEHYLGKEKMSALLTAEKK